MSKTLVSFGTLLKPPRGGENMLQTFGQIFSPPSLDILPKLRILMAVLVHPQTKRHILRIYRPCFFPTGFTAVV